MKRSTLFMGLAAAAFLLASCTKDTIEVSSGASAGSDGAEEYVYLSAEVRLPAGDSFGTRSATDETKDPEGYHPSDANPNTEVGKEYENRVQTCLLVIADQNDKFLAVSAVNGIKMDEDLSNPGFTATAKFDRKLIKKIYEGDNVDGEGKLKNNAFHIFAFCNPSDLLTQKFIAIGASKANGDETVKWSGKGAATYDLSDLTGIVEEDPMQPGATPTVSNNMWAPGRFMMANASVKGASLPKTEKGWDHHASSANPFDLTGPNHQGEGDDEVINEGVIKVERLAARFDYRDASLDVVEGKTNGVGNNIYKVLGSMDSGGGSEDETHNFVNIKLSRIGLVNMAKEVYYLKRVSDDGREYKEAADRTKYNWALCGKEKSIGKFNYVVSPHAGEMNDGTTVATVTPWYNFALFSDEEGGYNKGAWSMYNLGDVVKGTEMDEWENNETHKKGQYHIWRYCTENTIPAGTNASDRENPLQDNLFTTGIVFKGKLIAGRYLGDTREATVEGKESEGTQTVPYMTYNVQRAILASTLGLDLANLESMSDEDFNKAKGEALAENGKLADLKLYNPDIHTKKEDVISWSTLSKNDFTDMTSYPGLYLFEGNLYAGFNEAAEYAYYDGTGGTLYQAMADVMSHYWVDKTQPTWITVAGVTGNGKGENKGKVQGYVQMTSEEVEAKKAEGHTMEQLTVNTFAEILGIRPKNAVGEYHDRKDYGVRWVDTGNNTATETANFKDWLTSGNSSFHFTLYDASNEEDNYGGETSTSQGWGYYCYYFYWNRHNDNGVPGVMAPMEFSVVRNNVYKLSVTKINQIGHPVDPSNDPDNPDPHDDDEKSEVYMKVDVQVLPWTVRLNNIEF